MKAKMPRPRNNNGSLTGEQMQAIMDRFQANGIIVVLIQHQPGDKLASRVSGACHDGVQEELKAIVKAISDAEDAMPRFHRDWTTTEVELPE